MVPPKIIADKVRSLDTGFLTIYYTNVPKYANKIYRPESVKEYENVFSHLPLPDSLKMENSLTDEFFSRSFVAGANPEALVKVNSKPSFLSNSI